MSGRKPALTLQHFILRAQVLSFYRSVIRASRFIPDPMARRETVKWMRDEIERNRNSDDKDQIKAQLGSARRMMKQLLPGFQLAASAPGPKSISKQDQTNNQNT